MSSCVRYEETKTPIGWSVCHLCAVGVYADEGACGSLPLRIVGIRAGLECAKYRFGAEVSVVGVGNSLDAFGRVSWTDGLWRGLTKRIWGAEFE